RERGMPVRQDPYRHRNGAHRVVDGGDCRTNEGRGDKSLIPPGPFLRHEPPEPTAWKLSSPVDLARRAVDGERDHRSMKVSPSTSTSILVRRKQSIASS